jgi:hypothetical protein
MANVIARGKKVGSFTVEEVSRLVETVNSLKASLEEWRQQLPAYYEAVSLPVDSMEVDDPDVLTNYPYEERQEYVASIISYDSSNFRNS